MLGEKIKFLRKLKGLTQADLARLAGVDNTYISQLERGKRPNVGLATLERIAQALGVTVADLNSLVPPQTIFDVLPDEAKLFYGSPDALPWLKIVPELAKADITPEMLLEAISLINRYKSKKDK